MKPQVNYTVRIEPETVPVKGNASALDPATDRLTEKWIGEELARGNQWAWCAVVVKAEYAGYVGFDYLGCCSYASEEDFRASVYFEDMKQEAFGNLMGHLRDIRAKGNRANAVLQELETLGK